MKRHTFSKNSTKIAENILPYKATFQKITEKSEKNRNDIGTLS
jgi:hypothetical protein